MTHEVLFDDRRDAGRALALALAEEDGVVVGLARGGVIVAAEVARALDLPLDVVAVRKVGHPYQAEYALGAVAPGGAVYVRDTDGLTEEMIAAALARAEELDCTLHSRRAPLPLDGRSCILVDDGLATGSTMIAAIRWAQARDATRVVAAIPVGARQSLDELRGEADTVVCPNELDELVAVGLWYRNFRQVTDDEVVTLLD